MKRHETQEKKKRNRNEEKQGQNMLTAYTYIYVYRNEEKEDRNMLTSVDKKIFADKLSFCPAFPYLKACISCGRTIIGGISQSRASFNSAEEESIHSKIKTRLKFLRLSMDSRNISQVIVNLRNLSIECVRRSIKVNQTTSFYDAIEYSSENTIQ